MTGSYRHAGRYGMYTSEKLAATGVTAEPSATATATSMLRLDRDGNPDRFERARGLSPLAVMATPVTFRVRGTVFLRRTGIGTRFLRSHKKGDRRNLR